MAIALVGETPHELIVLKPAGLACETPRDSAGDSLLRRLQGDGAGPLRLVHRLDAIACGLVLVARTREAAAFHGTEIAARRWRKLYVARVAVPAVTAGALVGPHKAYLKTVGLAARVVRSGGKPSFLDVLAAWPTMDGRQDSHVLVALHTGRFHQIRAMLAHLGAPLCGDWRYGGPRHGGFYLEHVALTATTCHGRASVAWTAPPHRDRDPWDPALAAAVADTLAG